MDDATIVKRAVEAAGGAAALSRSLGITVQSVFLWTQVPAKRVVKVSRITGIPCHELRPDVFPSPEEASTLGRSA